MCLGCLAEQITAVSSRDQPGGAAEGQQPPGVLPSHSRDVKLEIGFEKRRAGRASTLLESAEEVVTGADGRPECLWTNG